MSSEELVSTIIPNRMPSRAGVHTKKGKLGEVQAPYVSRNAMAFPQGEKLISDEYEWNEITLWKIKNAEDTLWFWAAQ